ncbi:MAG: hypothetical protein AAGL69_01480 [Pseudomonadota bacterium]
MRIIIGFLLGFVPGVALALGILLWNPSFDTEATPRLSTANLKLPVSGSGTYLVTRSADGYPWLSTQPAFSPAPAIEGTRSALTVLQANTGLPDRSAYVARLQVLTDEGRPLFGELIESSLFYVVLPELGGMLVTSEDDLWGFARQVTLPLARGVQWRGDLAYRSTIGPAGGFANVYGVEGLLTDLTGRAELIQSVRALSLTEGIIDGDGRINVDLELPTPEAIAERGELSQTP